MSVLESQAGPRGYGWLGATPHSLARYSGAGSVADMDRLKVLCFAGTYGLALCASWRG